MESSFWKRCLALVALPALMASSAAARGAVEDEIRRAEDFLVEGDRFGAQDACLRALEAVCALPAHEREAWLGEALLALHRLREIQAETGSYRASEPVLRAWAELPGAGEAEPSAVARHMLGWTRLESTGSREEAEAVWKPLGFLNAWTVIGPFDNERGGGLLTEYGPEKELRMDAKYPGEKRDVAWRPLPVRPLAGEVDLESILDPDKEVLAYALTYLHCDEEMPAALRLGTDEGFRLWVNGALVASADLDRELSLDQNVVGVQLAKGWNSILIKLPQGAGNWRFLLRCTRPDGLPLAGAREGKPAEGEPVPRLDAPPPAPAVAESVESALRKNAEASPADARSRYVLGALLSLRKAHDETEHPDTECFRQAIALDEGRALYRLDLARSHERRTEIEAQKDENNWRLALEKASALGSAEADYRLADYYLRTFDNRSRAADHVERALRRNPSHEAAILLRGQVGRALAFPRAWETAVEEAWKLPRRSASLWAVKAEALLQEGKAAEAEAVLREALQGHAVFPKAREMLADILVGQDKVDEGLEVIERIAGFAPFDIVHWRRKLAGYLEGRDRLEDALRQTEEASRVAPEDHSLHVERGKLLVRLGRKVEALEALDLALTLQPNLPEVREYVEILRAGAARFEDEFRRPTADLARKALGPPGENLKGDPARVLLELTALDVHRDGTTKEFVQRLVHIMTDRGIQMHDRFGTYYAAGEQVVEFRKARVLRQDGTAAEARLSRFGEGEEPPEGGGYRSASVDLPPVSVGDVVEIEYVREDTRQSFFGDYFGRREIFQEEIPIDERVLILRMPLDKTIYFHQRNMEVQPEEKRDETSGSVTRVWQLRDIPKLEAEPAMPPAREVCPVLEISTFESWDALSKWYWNLIRRQFEVSPEISKKVRELTSGAGSEMDKIRAIYNFVTGQIRYNAWPFGVHGFKPYNAATIFERRFGDCKDKSTLLCVMLKEAGITAWPVIIEARDRRSGQPRGDQDLTLPMLDHFNHVITYVPASAGRGELYLDGTAMFHSIQELPSMDHGARVLVVRDDGGAIHQIPWNEPSEFSVEEETTVTLGQDLSAEIQIRARARGDFAVNVRAAFEIPAQRKANLERLLGARMAGVAVTSESFSDLGNVDEPVSFTLALAAPHWVVEAPEGLAAPAPEDFFSTGRSLESAASLEVRKFDVLLGSPRRSVLEMSYVLPAGLKVKSLPQDHDISSRFGRLQVAWKVESPEGAPPGAPPGEPIKVIAKRLLEITTHRIPVKDYAEFREFVAGVNRLEQEKLLLER